MLIPYLKHWILIAATGDLLAPDVSSLPLDTLQKSIVKRVIEGGSDLDDLGKMFTTAWDTDPGRVRALLSRFFKGVNCIDVADLDIPKRVDAVIVDRGWGGVFQHAVDLWQALNRNHQVLLIAPNDPMYGFPDSLSRLLVTPQRLGLPKLSLVSTVCLARTILKKLSFDLLLFTHRIMTPYFFDIVRDHPTIIYGDSFSEASLRIGESFAPDPPNRDIVEILQELYFGAPEPWQSMIHSKAMYWTFKNATENWFWCEDQHAVVLRDFPQFANRFHIVLPPIDTERLTPAKNAAQPPWILFTTTSEKSKVGAKGLIPLLKVVDRIPSAKLRLVLHDESCIPTELNVNRLRGEVLVSVPKEQMLQIYREAVVNCRISREDSSPVSILESMACGVPVMVSPVIARNIPIIKDGVTGFVVEPDDLDRIEEKLNFVLNNPQERNQMGTRARDVVLQHSLLDNLERITRFFYASSAAQPAEN